MKSARGSCTVVFDLDGTLIDSAPDLAGALNDLLIIYERPVVALSEVRTMVGDGAVALIKRGFGQSGGFDSIPMEVLRTRFLEFYAERMTADTRLYPGVAATLDTLAKRDCRIALCTNKPAAMAGAILRHFGIRQRFAALLGGDSLRVRKPDPEHLRTTVRDAEGEMTRAIMVGDSSTDVNTARRAGVPSIAVSYGYSVQPACDLGADAVVDHLDQVPDVLVRWGMLG